MASMQREFDRMFRDLVGRGPWAFWRRNGGWQPTAELVETKDSLVLTLELPGVETKDVDISLEDGAVRVKGEKRGLDQSEVKVHVGERFYGPFERKIALPAAALPEAVKASLVNGVMIVTIPKREEAKRRAVPITAD
jgi:HSP20 family protein